MELQRVACGYIYDHLHEKMIQYNHESSKRAKYCSYEPNPTNFSKKVDIVIPEDNFLFMDKENTKYVQQVSGSFYFMNMLLT